MIPQMDVILKTVGTNLLTKYVPKLDLDNEKAEMALMAFLMGAVSEEFERAAHRRIEENMALRKLFNKSLPEVKDENLRSKLKKASEEVETDWRISSLEKSNNAMIELLIELHCHIESFGNEETKNLEKDIWEELKNYSKRREFMTWELSESLLLEARKG